MKRMEKMKNRPNVKQMKKTNTRSMKKMKHMKKIESPEKSIDYEKHEKMRENDIDIIAYSSLVPLSSWRHKDGENSKKTDQMTFFKPFVTSF